MLEDLKDRIIKAKKNKEEQNRFIKFIKFHHINLFLIEKLDKEIYMKIRKNFIKED